MSVKTAEIVSRWNGTPYRLNGRDERGVDCVGLIYVVYADLGIVLPGSDRPHGRGVAWIDSMLALARQCFRPVEVDQAEPLDIMLFKIAYSTPIFHCGLFAGKNKILHQYGTKAASIEPMAYWKSRLWKTLRLNNNG